MAFYLVVNYDRCEREPEIFDSFDKAKARFKELKDRTYTLECYDKWYNRRILIGKGKPKYKKFNKDSK